MSDDTDSVTDPDTDTGGGAATPSLGDFNAQMIDQFRAEGRRMVFGPMQLLVLTTRGAKSGAARATPLVAYTEDGRVFVIASKGGAPSHPAWYHNLRAHPTVGVEFDGDEYTAEAQVLPDAERDALYPRIVEAAPQFGEYQQKTTRRIPVVELRRS